MGQALARRIVGPAPREEARLLGYAAGILDDIWAKLVTIGHAGQTGGEIVGTRNGTATS
jgi:hypothetical protein